MGDEEKIKRLYEDMYAAMVAKDVKTLERVHDDSFALSHMTGMRQDKKAYIEAIKDGTLNYYSADTEDIKVSVSGDKATLRGRSRVNAAVFGGGRRTWRLELFFQLKKTDGEWRLAKAEASTY